MSLPSNKNDFFFQKTAFQACKHVTQWQLECVVFLYSTAIILSINGSFVLTILPFKRMHNATTMNEHTGFALPCQYWLLALKYFFSGEVGIYWATCKISYQSCFLVFQIFFNCSFAILYFHLCELFFAHLSTETLTIFIWIVKYLFSLIIAF